MRSAPHWSFRSILLLLLAIPPSVSAFENLIQAQGEVRKDILAKPLRFASPDWNIYHRTNHLHAQIVNISHTCNHAHVTAHISIPSEPLTSGGASSDRHITLNPANNEFHSSESLSSATDGLLYVIIRPTESTTRSKAHQFATGLLRRHRPITPTRVMFVFGEEGRDLLTSEVALTVLQQICLPHHPPTNPPLANAVTRLNEGVELVLVPVANPDGRRIAEMGRRCDRTNANDVDVDRNWPSFWGEPAAYNAHRAAPPSKNSLRAAVSSRLVGKTHTSSSGTYIAPSGGTHPFSEPETRALRAIVEKVTPISYVSVRTGAVAVTVPWDCKPELLADAQRERLFKVTEGITAGHCTRCKMGTLWNVTGRVKCGTGVDYMYGTQHVQFVHSWHVYDVAAPRGDCFRKHNPISQAAYSRVTANWAHAVLNFTTSVHNWLTLESSEGLGVAERNASLSAAEASTRRSEALARGIPDPEKDESEKELGIGKAEPGLTYSKYKGKGGTGIKLHHARIFSWMVKDRNTSDMVGRNDMVDKMNIGPQLSNEKAAELEEGKLGMLTGWWGVWAAMLMLGAGFFVAKQYVFKGRARRSRFRSRTPTKNA